MIVNPSIWGALRNRADNDVWDLVDAGAPTSGTSGTGVNLAGPGSTYVNTTAGTVYINTNTKASPTWTLIAANSGTFTNPTINAAGGTIVLPTSTTPAQTAEGSIVWDSDDDVLTIGDGASRKTVVMLGATQTLTGKTLTSPTINGATIATSTLTSPTITTPVETYAAQSIAALGTNQGNAAAITATCPGNVLVTAADGTVGVILPAAVAGKIYFLKNADAANAVLKVYPATGEVINAIAANGAISMAAKTAAVFMCAVTGTWLTISLLPS